jgi:transposase InsO family protein
MVNYRTMSNVQITQAKGVLPVEGCGTLLLSFPSTTGSVSVKLKNVLYIPGASLTLLSVSKLVDGGASVSFDSRRATIRLPGGVVHGRRLGGLYVIDAIDDGGEFANIAVLADSVLRLHRSYNHANLQRLQRMLREGDLPKLQPGVRDQLLATRTIDCVDCGGKTVTRPLPKSSTSVYPVLGKVHSDYCGPFPSSRHGRRYVMSMIDDPSASGFVYIRHLASRAVAWTVTFFDDYVTMAELQTGKRLKIFQCDNAKEYTSNAMKLRCAEKGCLMQLCTPHRHGQNGVAERWWRTLQEGSGVLIIQSGLPPSYREEAMNCITFLHNRTPVNGRTRFERFFGRKAVLPTPRSFGCLAHSIRPVVLRRKGASRIRECIMLGYSRESKGAYLLLALDTRRVLVRRDVRFYDDNLLSPQLLPLSSNPPSHNCRCRPLL